MTLKKRSPSSLSPLGQQSLDLVQLQNGKDKPHWWSSTIVEDRKYSRKFYNDAQGEDGWCIS